MPPERHDNTAAMGIRAAARELGVHENTIRNWINRGLLLASALPTGIRRVPRSEVERMRREMREQYAPTTTLPEPQRGVKGQPVEGDMLP
jgi:transposase